MEGFAQDLFLGLKEIDAYKRHYSTKNRSINALYVDACRLAAHPKIVLRLAELRNCVTAKNKATIEERYEILSEIARKDIERPISAGQKVAAIKEINLMDNLYSQTVNYNDIKVLIVREAQGLKSSPPEIESNGTVPPDGEPND